MVGVREILFIEITVSIKAHLNMNYLNIWIFLMLFQTHLLRNTKVEVLMNVHTTLFHTMEMDDDL